MTRVVTCEYDRHPHALDDECQRVSTAYATDVRPCRGLELFTFPDRRIIAVRERQVTVGFTWWSGVEWRARRMSEEFDYRVASQHAGAAYVVRGCPDCSCAVGCDGVGCVGCSYCLRGCSEGLG